MLQSRVRRAALMRLGPAACLWLPRFLARVVPRSLRALRVIEARAQNIEDGAFRAEALASIDQKAYHVAGGCFLATFLPRVHAQRYLDIVVPLESLYDYLDNLCDRHPGIPSEAYPVLHEALRDALDPARPIADYFRAGPAGGDGGYLTWLVTQTREAMGAISGLPLLGPYLNEAAAFYAALQTFKHADEQRRIAALRSWHQSNARRFRDLRWWEFAAACGSQFHVYVLLYFALVGRPQEGVRAYDAYFPEFCAIHVLLDDFIDQAEDTQHAELNFISRYGSSGETVQRMRHLRDVAVPKMRRLSPAAPHRALFRLLPLFYLTHRKVYEQSLDAQAQALLTAIG